MSENESVKTSNADHWHQHVSFKKLPYFIISIELETKVEWKHPYLALPRSKTTFQTNGNKVFGSMGLSP